MLPKLLAFDLDGTLLRSDKTLSPANRAALHDMAQHGCVVALASGRIGSSILRAVADLDLDVALLTLNGAAVYKSRYDKKEPVYSARLPREYADFLITYSETKPFALNYYCDGELYAVRNDQTAQWLDLYFAQTSSPYRFRDSLSPFVGTPPFKAIFVGDKDLMDAEEAHFRSLWGAGIYIVRTWDYYLEFLHRDANKGSALIALASSFGIDIADVAAFGDAANDIPMLSTAGIGIAMKNADAVTRKSARYVSAYTNDEDGIAREWERLKAG